MEEILAIAKNKVDQAEVFVQKITSTPVNFANNKLKGIEQKNSFGVALRVIKDGKVGFATTTKPGNYAKLVELAIGTARYGREAEFSFAAPAPVSTPEIYDQMVEELSEDVMMAMGRDYIQSVTAYESKVLAGASLQKSIIECQIFNTQGLYASYRKTYFSALLTAELVEGENRLETYQGMKSTHLPADLNFWQRKVIGDIKNGRVNAPFRSGTYPVILTPGAFAQVLYPILVSVDGKAVHRRMSSLADKLAQPILDSRLTIIDDGRLHRGPASVPVDDEGTPTRRNFLVENGVLQSFYTDLATAKALGLPPTGNGKRQRFTAMPTTGLHNVIAEPGDTPLADMIANIKEGLIVDQMMGATQGNMFGGQITGNISLGFVVQNGQIVGRVKDAMFSTNAFIALKDKIAAISKEREWFSFGDALLPYVMLQDVSISTK